MDIVKGDRLAPPLLDIQSLRGLLNCTLLLSAAWVLPALCHLLGAPVLWLLPMHWPVILAGLLYGWRGGLLVGLLAPGLSLLLSGRPAGVRLVLMTAELGVYGLTTGLTMELSALKGRLSALVALLSGRLVYATLFAFLVSYPSGYLAALGAALMPGVPAAAAMALLLPPLAERLRRSTPTDE